MRYPGGKGKCFQRLINLMPLHDIYIETHLGGGAVLRAKRPAQRSIGVDLDPRSLAACADTGIPGLELHQQDAVEFLHSFEFTGMELVYADPPYMPSTRRRARVYRFDYTAADHATLLAALLELPCQVMVSGYDNPLYREMLSGWRHVTFLAKSHTGLREESVWMNFPEPRVLHDGRYLGSTFHERQAIRRRQVSLRRKISALQPAERAEFVRWWITAFGRSIEESPCSTLA